MKNYKVEVKEDSAGKITATAVSRDFGQALGDSITTLASGTEASVGYVKTGVVAGLVYAMGVYAKSRQTGGFSWNPF